MNREQIFNKVNAVILEMLNQGKIPWLNPMQGSLPANFVSKHFYQGINWLLLSHLDFKSPYFLTFLQCQQKNGSVLKGAEGFPVVFWKLMDGIPDENGNADKFPYIRFSYVFNITQTTLYDNSKENELKVQHQSAEDILNNIIKLHNPKIDFNFRGKGFYQPSTHSICVPPIDSYANPDSYYDVLFHELIHWTGKALKRESDHKYGSEQYSFEELVAEIGSSYLCTLAGIDRVIDNQAGYIQGWLSKIEGDNSLIIKASTAAKKAVNFLINNQSTIETAAA